MEWEAFLRKSPFAKGGFSFRVYKPGVTLFLLRVISSYQVGVIGVIDM
jgi:hypothetical protein